MRIINWVMSRMGISSTLWHNENSGNLNRAFELT